MKYIVLLLLSLFALNSYADPSIIYVNGGFNDTKEKAIGGAKLFYSSLKKHTAINSSNGNLKALPVIQNSTETKQAIACQRVLAERALPNGIGSVYDENTRGTYLYNVGLAYDYSTIAALGVCLTSGAKKMISLTRNFSEEIKRLLPSGIVLVGHSQGNIYIESALGILAYQNVDISKIRTIGIASMTATSLEGSYFNLSLDTAIYGSESMYLWGGIQKTASDYPCLLPCTKLATYQEISTKTKDDYIHGISTYLNNDIISYVKKESIPRIIANATSKAFNDLKETVNTYSISPLFATISKDITFTVTGSNLTDGMGFAVQDCSPSSNELAGGTSTQRQFRCTFNSTPGIKSGVLKDVPGGTELFNFNVNVAVGKGNSWLSTITPPNYIVKNTINIDFDNLPNGAFSGTGTYAINLDSIACHLTQSLSVTGTKNGSAIDIQTIANSPKTTCSDGTHTGNVGWTSNYSGTLNAGVLLLNPNANNCDFNLDKCYNFTSFSPAP